MAGEKILVVDDEKHIVRLLQVNLEKVGYKVSVAYDGEEALKKIEEDLPSVIILDIMMPKLDGIETLKKIKENPKTKRIPVIMLTAKSADEDILTGWREGADSYLTKPFEPAEVIIMVKGILKDINNFGGVP